MNAHSDVHTFVGQRSAGSHMIIIRRIYPVKVDIDYLHCGIDQSGAQGKSVEVEGCAWMGGHGSGVAHQTGSGHGTGHDAH